jgi:hypothetical protein
MPGAYPPAAVGHGQDGPGIIRIDSGREKGAVILGRSFACRPEKCVRSGKGGILLPGADEFIILLKVDGKAVDPSVQADGIMQNYSGKHE